MKRRTLWSVLLAVSLLLGLLSGCGGESSSNQESASSGSVAEATEAPVEQETPETETPAAQPEASVVESTVEAETEETTTGDPFAAMAEEYITYPLAGENTISIWYYAPGYVEYVDSNYKFNAIDEAEAATGVKLEFIEVGNTTAAEQFNLMVASGDMTDLIPASEYYTGGLTKAYEEDIIVDINEYVEENMPNYAAVFETLDEKTQREALSDGMMLAFRIIADGSYSGNGFVTRSDWMQELGVSWDSNLISLEEFTDYLRDIHSTFDTPYTYYMTDGTINLQAAFDTAIPALVSDGFMTFVTSAIFREGDTVNSGWITDGYRAYLEWIRTMMAEGILYEDFLSLENSKLVMNEYCGTGLTGVWMANADKIEETAAYATEADYGVAAVPNIVADPEAPYVWLQDVSLVTTNVGFSISADCNQPELVCQWMNYFWTTDGYYMANYGVEGESYHMEGDTAVFDWDKPITDTGKTAPNAEMAQQLFTMMRFTSFYSDHDRLLPTFPDSALEAIEIWNPEGSDERYYPTTLEAGFTVDENAKIAEYEQDMLTYAQETCLKFMTGELEITDQNWNDYVATMEEMGIYEVIAVYQNAYDQYLAGER